MSEKALATVEQLAIEDVKRLANIVRSLRNDVFKPDLDYGVIPGTGTKPTLLLPGMEKLMRALHLRAEYIERSKIEDFDNNRIYYRYECRLIDYETGHCVATAIGSANSYETKWRWREQKRTCPKCGKETINRSKFASRNAPEGTEPGWYCHSKIGGCGAEFAAKDPVIVNQQTGRIENPDIFDQMNVIDKIAQKRALSSAIKGAANVSEFFTVDLEDFQQYDTTPPVISMDDGRDVDTVTGEVVTQKPAPPVEAVTPPQAKTVLMDNGAAYTLVDVKDDSLPDDIPDDEPADLANVFPRDEQPEQPALGLVEPVAQHPKSKRTWDLGRVKTYTIQERKYIAVKGATPHFDALISKLEASLRITDTSTTEDVCAAIDKHYNGVEQKAG